MMADGVTRAEPAWALLNSLPLQALQFSTTCPAHMHPSYTPVLKVPGACLRMQPRLPPTPRHVEKGSHEHCLGSLMPPLYLFLDSLEGLTAKSFGTRVGNKEALGSSQNN